MNYKITIKKNAKKFIDKLPQEHKIRIVEVISALPSGTDIKKMKGYENVYRSRVGQFRIIWTLDNDELKICVIVVASRGDVYK